MAYNFGNIFVQAMENQKRLATQRQQFDQEMGFRRDQMAQQESQFIRGHELDRIRTGYEGERLGIEKARDKRESQRHTASKTTNPDALMTPYGYAPGAFGKENYLDILNPWVGQGLMRMDMDWRHKTHQPRGDYWVDEQGGRKFVEEGREIPTGFHRNVDEALTFKTMRDIDTLTAKIQPQLSNIQVRPTAHNLEKNLGQIEAVLNDLKGVDISRITPDQRQKLGLDDIAASVAYTIELLNPQTGNKDLQKRLGRENAHRLSEQARDIYRSLFGMGTDIPQGVYSPGYGPNLIEKWFGGSNTPRGLLDLEDAHLRGGYDSQELRMQTLNRLREMDEQRGFKRSY